MRVIPRRNIAHYRGQLADILGLAVRGAIIEGPHIRQFEEQFARYVGTGHAVAVSSGRAGLSLILESLQLQKGAEIIMPAYTDESVPETVLAAGFEPVFADIERATHNIDAASFEKAISEKTRAVIATHIFGRPCDLSKIMEISRRRDLFVIEDCAHALGAEYRGRRVGSFGAAAYFSFGITKPFNTFGGGMITTNEPELYARIAEKVSRMGSPAAFTLAKNAAISFFLSLITTPVVFSFTLFPVLLLLSFSGKDLIQLYNKTVKRTVKSRGGAVKFTNLQALMGIRQLGELDAQNERRRRNAAVLSGAAAGAGGALEDDPASKPTYYFFVAMPRNARKLSGRLLRRGIDTGKHIMRDCSARYGRGTECPVAREAACRSLQIPNYPRLTRADMEYAAGILYREFKNYEHLR